MLWATAAYIGAVALHSPPSLLLPFHVVVAKVCGDAVCRPSYEALLGLLQSAGLPSADYRLPDRSGPPGLLQAVHALRAHHPDRTDAVSHLQRGMQGHAVEGRGSKLLWLVRNSAVQHEAVICWLD